MNPIISHILLRAKTLKFKYIFKYYKKKIQSTVRAAGTPLEDIIIIIRMDEKDLRNESLRKEIERMKENESNERTAVYK